MLQPYQTEQNGVAGIPVHRPQRQEREPLGLLVGELLSVSAVMAVLVAPVLIVVAFLLLI